MTENYTSLSLLKRAQDNNEEAWTRLIGLYTPLVYYWCRRSGVQGEDVHDVVQNVFQAIAGKLDRFQRGRPGDGFRAWLRGIARHKIMDYFRVCERQPAAEGGSTAQMRLAQLPQQWDEWSGDDSQEELAALYLRTVELVRCEFEENTWQAFWQTGVEGKSAAEVGAALGMSDVAVRKAKSRVLRRLKEEAGELI